MNIRRSWFVFLVMLLIAVCIVALAAEKPILETWNKLHGASDGCSWQCIGTNGGRIAAAAGWRSGELELRYFTTDGESLAKRRAALPEELSGGTVTRVLPLREGLAILGIYGPNAETLFLYRIPEKGEAERLLSLDCPGGSFAERTERTKLSELLYENGVVSFAVWTDDTLACYICRESGGLEAVGTGECGGRDVLSVYSDQNGTLLLGGTGFLSLNGREEESLVERQAVTRLTQGRGGWYFIDAASLDLCFVDAAFGASYRLFHLDTGWNGVQRRLTSAALTREESALMLLDDTYLTLSDANGMRDLAGVLHAKPFVQWLSLAKYAGIAIAAAALLWVLLIGLRRGYAPLSILRGSLFIAGALLCLTVLRFAVLIPTSRSATLQQNAAVTSGLMYSAHAESRMSDGSLPAELCRMLEGADAERGSNVRAVLASYRDGAWMTADGRLAVTADGFSPALADAAASNGPVASLENGAFYYVAASGGKSLTVRVEDPVRQDGYDIYNMLVAGFAVLTLFALLILISVGSDLRKISDKMESISRGGVPERLTLRTGDELESMASVVNSLGDALRSQEKRQESVELAYRRFVPEKVLALLGKQSVREVDKSTFAARRMAVMTVSFSFPDSFYTDMDNSRLLFDSVNEVIERTASIAAKKGGTAFHFSYYGFDVVMDEDGDAVSTAVAIQQEVLSFNEQREQNGLPAVTLRIALDKGNVMLGIVGDASKMEPTTISSCLSTVQELTVLCGRLKAGILCTEAIISQRQEYGSRYMGKCIVGKQTVRVYEVFDGDEFRVRRGKAGSVNEFTKGVYDLYGGDASGAKHAFLQLAHNYPFDGGARYYLYLADRLEHDPSLPCVLNLDNADGEEV